MVAIDYKTLTEESPMGPLSQSQRRIHLPPLGAIIALTLFCKNCSLQCLVKNYQIARESPSCHLTATEMVRQWSPRAACMVPNQVPLWHAHSQERAKQIVQWGQQRGIWWVG